MYPTNFDYYRPSTVQEAVALLSKDPNAKVLAGGHSLLPAMKLRTSMPSALVDIGRITDLAGIKDDGNMLTIGAMTTHAKVAASDVVKSKCPILAETAAVIGDVQVRNRGTLGGSLAHADPAADYPTTIVALGATLTVMGTKGSRSIPADRFFKDLFTTALDPAEMITAIGVPAYGTMKGMGGAYITHEHPASSYSVVGVAALVGLENGKCARVSLVLGGATANPVHADAAEKTLTGQEPSGANIEAAAAQVVKAIAHPLSDVYASGEYRMHLATVLAKRALMAAAARAQA
jgi:carbon-monoxide dehydrogenase medium subunit